MAKKNDDGINQNTKYLETKTTKQQRVTIKQRKPDGKSISVTAPLPDGFGMTVGSEYSTPFDTANINNMLSKGLYLAGIGQKAGLLMNKFYSNPVPTEVSFEMEFFSYYNAFEEVVIPSVLLMNMSLGRNKKWEGLKQDIKSWIETAKEAYQQGVSFAESALPTGPNGEKKNLDIFKNARADVTTPAVVDKSGERIMELFGIIDAPETVTISFGDVYRLTNCYITHVGTKYSNILDIAGYPTHCTCSVTATLERAPVADDISSFYNFKGVV
jgi:hypothetical protein